MADAERKPQGCTNLKLKQASRLVARHYEGYAGATGLRSTQYSLLSGVVKLGPLRLGDLAKAMRLDASTLSRNLQPLLDKGLVELHTGADARSRTVQATPAGRVLRDEAQKDWKQAQLALNRKLGPERVFRLHALLEECMATLAAQPGASR
jgi:DNA-binding MarR family transcriptional regulator